MAGVERPIRSLVRRLRGLRSATGGGPAAGSRAPGADDRDGSDDRSLRRLVDPYLPRDHARQVNATYYGRLVMADGPTPHRVMDLGCGTGGSVDLFRSIEPDVDWVGVDVETSRASAVLAAMP